jgi:glyoxylase-like metal-dependent hydrolase (beta-lactamase superfamily II)
LHIVRFFNIGNADSCLIELENGRLALFDFADMRNKDDASDKRCDLEKELRECLGDDKEIDVVAFTHLDTDHCNRAKDVFHLEHAAKYQGGDRIKIKTMWVPATAILEEGVEGQARTLRAEARHRFIEGKGIRVFSRPDALDQFLRDRDIEPSKRRNLISDAGTLCPEFNLASDSVEFFAHSPFAEHTDNGVIVRNA